MASITSLSGSSSSSIYSNPNAITGLASGLDTEAMIEQAVSSYEKKMESIQQDKTKVEWQQAEYRELIEKIASFMEKYTDYTSDTNLTSSSFFNNASVTTASGTYANLVSASGKTDSAVSLLGVKQLAKAAVYSVGASNSTGAFSSAAIDLSATTVKSTITGGLSLKFGDNTISLSFREEELAEVNDADGLADLINKKLEEENINFTSGDTKAANEYIAATVVDGQLVIGTKDSAGSSVSVSGATGDFARLLTKDDEGEYTTTLDTSVGLTQEVTLAEALEGEKLSFTYNGTTKSITLGKYDTVDALKTDLQAQLDEAFGVGSVTVGQTDEGGLSLTVASGSTLAVSGSALEKLGFSDSTQSTYMDVNDTLGALMGEQDSYTLTVNNKTFTFTADQTLKDVMNEINKSDAGVTASFSSLTNKFTFTAKETGSAGKVELSGDVADTLFGGGTRTAGQDAVFSAEVNGDTIELTRSSNTVDLDGMKVTLKGAFGYENGTLAATAADNAVSFNTSADTEKITEAVKAMIKDYNELVTAVKKSYTTKPLTDSSGKRYKPLTEDDQADMSENAIESYEKKAKTGLLYGDQDLSSMYNQLVNAITSHVVDLEKIGINTVYSNGLTTLKLDEDKLEETLESDPSAVSDVLAGTNGFASSINTTLKKYGGTVGATKGILVQKAGSERAPTTVNQNTLQTKMNEYQELIEKWREKLSDKIDYYSRQFSMLEQLMAEMNSQSSSLSGMMGGY